MTLATIILICAVGRSGSVSCVPESQSDGRYVSGTVSEVLEILSVDYDKRLVSDKRVSETFIVVPQAKKTATELPDPRLLAIAETLGCEWVNAGSSLMLRPTEKVWTRSSEEYLDLLAKDVEEHLTRIARWFEHRAPGYDRAREILLSVIEQDTRHGDGIAPINAAVVGGVHTAEGVALTSVLQGIGPRALASIPMFHAVLYSTDRTLLRDFDIRNSQPVLSDYNARVWRHPPCVQLEPGKFTRPPHSNHCARMVAEFNTGVKHCRRFIFDNG